MDLQQQITEFLSQNYPIEPGSHVEQAASGEENRSFFVSARSEQYVLRVYSTHHSTTGPRQLSEIEFELDFMAAAQAHGVPTPPVIHAKSGERVTTTIINSQSRFAILFGYAQGKGPAEYTPKIASKVAEVLLALRQTSLGFRKPCPRPWPGDIARLSLDFYAANREHLRLLLGHHLDPLDCIYHSALSGYAEAVQANFPTGVIHGDVKLGNLLFADEKVSAVIDFDDYRETFLLEEFTRTVMHDLDSPTRNVIRAGCYPVFLKALAADSTLTSAEMEHLTTFLRARLVYDLAAYILSGLHDLADEVLADQHVRDVIFSGL